MSTAHPKIIVTGMIAVFHSPPFLLAARPNCNSEILFRWHWKRYLNCQGCMPPTWVKSSAESATPRWSASWKSLAAWTLLQFGSLVMVAGDSSNLFPYTPAASSSGRSRRINLGGDGRAGHQGNHRFSGGAYTRRCGGSCSL